MTGIVVAFKALSLETQTEAPKSLRPLMPPRTRADSSSKRRAGLGFKPDEGKKAPATAVKYRSHRDPTETWAGRGAEPIWLKAEMAETGKSIEVFRA
jgi:hypothetical protein